MPKYFYWIFFRDIFSNLLISCLHALITWDTNVKKTKLCFFTDIFCFHVCNGGIWIGVIIEANTRIYFVWSYEFYCLDIFSNQVIYVRAEAIPSWKNDQSIKTWLYRIMPECISFTCHGRWYLRAFYLWDLWQLICESLIIILTRFSLKIFVIFLHTVWWKVRL